MKSKLMVMGVLLASLVSASAMAQGPGYRFNQKNTPGWSLMSKEERTEFRDQMMAAKSFDECVKIQSAHHEEMLKRAKEKGVTLHMPRRNACERMKERGMFK